MRPQWCAAGMPKGAHRCGGMGSFEQRSCVQRYGVFARGRSLLQTCGQAYGMTSRCPTYMQFIFRRPLAFAMAQGVVP